MGENPGPLVSIVVTTHYRNRMLREAIESALGQTYEPIELVVVDDSGERHAEAAVEVYDGLTYLPLEENRGLASAREAGVREASGAYVQFLDDDDVLLPAKVASQVPLFGPGTGVVYCGYEVYETGERVMPREGRRGDVLDYALQGRIDPACTCTLLVERDLIEGILPLEEHNHGAEILGIIIELARSTGFEFVDEPLARVRRAEDHSRFSDHPRLVNGLRRIVRTYADLYESTDPRNYRYMMARIHRQTATGILGQRVWSPSAVVHAALATYYTPEHRLRNVGLTLATLLGSPGVRFGEALLGYASGP